MSPSRTYPWLLVICQLCSAAAAEPCLFPSDWSGTWLDLENTPNPRLTFSRDLLSSKGRCVASKPDIGAYVLIVTGEDSNPSCYFCIVFVRWTGNVLQYKEATVDQMYCPPVGATRIETIQPPENCPMSVANGELRTMIREAPVPVACPFRGQFTFIFNRPNGGCLDVVDATEVMPGQQSTVHSCASESQQLWTFVKRPCNSDVVDALKGINVQCFSSWRDSDNWLYIKYDAEYRCAKYHIMPNGQILLYLSEDGTCNNRNGYNQPITMRLTGSSPAHRQASGSCDFPSWISDRTWSDLSGQLIYSATAPDQSRLRTVRRMIPQRANYLTSVQAALHNETLSTHNCLSQLYSGSYVTSAIEECRTGYRCLTLQKLSLSVAMITYGSLATNADQAACLAEGDISVYPDTDRRLVFDWTNWQASCPFLGAFTVQQDVCGKEIVYQVGCSRGNTAPASLIVMQTCNSLKERNVSCLAAWTANSKKYVVIGVKRPGNDTVEGTCYAYRSDGTVSGSVHLTLDRECNSWLLPALIRDALMPETIDMYPLKREGLCDTSPALQEEFSSIQDGISRASRGHQLASTSAIIRMMSAVAFWSLLAVFCSTPAESFS